MTMTGDIMCICFCWLLNNNKKYTFRPPCFILTNLWRQHGRSSSCWGSAGVHHGVHQVSILPPHRPPAPPIGCLRQHLSGSRANHAPRPLLSKMAASRAPLRTSPSSRKWLTLVSVSFKKKIAEADWKQGGLSCQNTTALFYLFVFVETAQLLLTPVFVVPWSEEPPGGCLYSSMATDNRINFWKRNAKVPGRLVLTYLCIIIPV